MLDPRRRVSVGHGNSSIPGPDDAYAIYLSPDERYLAVGSQDNRLAVYRLAGERLGAKLFERSVDLATPVSWSENGDLLAFVNPRGFGVVLSVPDGQSVLGLGLASALAFYPDNTRLAVLQGASLNVYTLDPPTTPPAGLHQTAGGGIGRYSNRRGDAVAVSPDSRLLACSTWDSIRILDLLRQAMVRELAAHSGTITGLEWLGADSLATSSTDGTIRIWEVSTGHELRVLEPGGMVVGITYAQVRDELYSWTDDTYHVWSAATGEIKRQESLPVPWSDVGFRYAAASRRSELWVTLDGPTAADITIRHGWDIAPQDLPVSVSTYANAKVLLLGDSGVGKSGLALRLAGEEFRPTESTHARHVWRMPVAELSNQSQSQREVLLWDLAGQPGYRIVHQLHLSDGAVALILFDSRSETTPLAGVGYWARALQHAQASAAQSGHLLPAFLVAARIDRGGVSVSNERIAEISAEFGFRACLSTSAKEGWGVDELRTAVLDAIDWARIPEVTSTALFAAAKSFVLDQKAGGTLLVPLAALLAGFIGARITGPAADIAPGAVTGRDLLATQHGDGDDQARLRRIFDGCVARLQSAGLVKHLAFGDLVLLQPELIDIYAGSIVNAARSEPDGLGSMLESRVLAVDFPIPADERIANGQQERLLIIATLEELTRYEIVLREETEQGVQLVFPAAFRRDQPDAAEPSTVTVEFTFEGPIANVYATLIVRLARSDRFSRRDAFKSAVAFAADSGGQCTVYLVQSDEGCGVLKVGYSEDVASVVRLQFERFVMMHLERHATPDTVRRSRLYTCPECDVRFTVKQAEEARRRGRTSLLCPIDETRVRLEDSYEALSQAQDGITRKMAASADAARSIAAATSVILGKEETTDFDVFLCHNESDKPAVRWMAQQLREHGILPWLDEAELIPGRPWQEELERQITHIRSAAVLVGPSDFGPWQNHEMRAFLDEFAQRGCPVIPVLLPGATNPDQLPVFLRRMTWVDLRARDAAGIERLIWGITGRKPASSGLG